jgi:hypothetical protein
MNWILFFVLWRAALICSMGFGIIQMYGWQPAPWFIFILLGIAADTIVTMLALRKHEHGSAGATQPRSEPKAQ